MLNIDQHTRCYHEKIFNQKIEFRVFRVIDNLFRFEQEHMIFEHDDEQLENQRDEETRFIISYFDDSQNRFEFCHFLHNYQFSFEYNDSFFRRDRFRRIFHDNIFENEEELFFFASSAARFSITTMRLNALKVFRKKTAKTILNRERDVEKTNSNARKNFLITRALLRVA